MSGILRARCHTSVCSCGVRLKTSDYLSADGTSFFYEDATARPFFRSTLQVVFDRHVLVWLGSLLERTQVSFEGFCDSLERVLLEGAHPGAGSNNIKSSSIDYRQAELAFIKWDLLQAQHEAQLPRSHPEQLRRDNLEQELLRVVPDLSSHFSRRWAANHDEVCLRPGWCKTLTFDLDAKIRRDVCMCRLGNTLTIPGHAMVRWP